MRLFTFLTDTEGRGIPRLQSERVLGNKQIQLIPQLDRMWDVDAAKEARLEFSRTDEYLI